MIFFAVKNTKEKTVKFLAVLLTFYAVLPVSQAFAYTYVRTPAGDVSSQTFDLTLTSAGLSELCPVIPFPPFDVPATAYRFALHENTLSTFLGDSLYSDPYTTETVVSFQATNSFEITIAGVFYECLRDGTWHAGESLENFVAFTILESTPPPPPPPPYTPLNFSLTGTSSNFLEKIGTPMVASVQTTGANLWPLFAFVGVSLAFIIALQLLVFTKRATGVSNTTLEHKTRSRGRKNPYSDPLHPDHEAFERGKKANKAYGIDLFPDDK